MDTEMINGYDLIDWILGNGLHMKTTFKVIEHIEDMIRENVRRNAATKIIKERAEEGKSILLRKF